MNYLTINEIFTKPKNTSKKFFKVATSLPNQILKPKEKQYL